MLSYVFGEKNKDICEVHLSTSGGTREHATARSVERKRENNAQKINRGFHSKSVFITADNRFGAALLPRN